MQKESLPLPLDPPPDVLVRRMIADHNEFYDHWWETEGKWCPPEEVERVYRKRFEAALSRRWRGR
jgi:hypothetical protein